MSPLRKVACSPHTPRLELGWGAGPQQSGVARQRQAPSGSCKCASRRGPRARLAGSAGTGSGAGWGPRRGRRSRAAARPVRTQQPGAPAGHGGLMLSFRVGVGAGVPSLLSRSLKCQASGPDAQPAVSRLVGAPCGVRGGVRRCGGVRGVAGV